MTQRIPYKQADSNLGKMVAQSVNDVMLALASARRTGKLLDATSSGSDWAALAGDLKLVDLPGYTALAQAQDLWTIFSTAKNAIDVAQVAELARLDQG